MNMCKLDASGQVEWGRRVEGGGGTDEDESKERHGGRICV